VCQTDMFDVRGH